MTGDTNAAAPPAAGAERQGPVLAPLDEAAHAIEEAQKIIAAAVADVASDDLDRLTHGYELAAGCSDVIARALWFLRRAERGAAAK